MTPNTSEVEVAREFVGLPSPAIGRAGSGGHPCQGIYHTPAGSRPKVAFIATHYNVDFSEHYLAPYLAARGFGFLGWNTRFRGAERYFLLDHAVADIGVGVRWLRETAGVDTVVVLGNSGGGSLMGAYQSQAVDPNIEPTYDARPLDAIADLVPADLYVSLAAHSGRPDVYTAWLDPSVTDEWDPTKTDPSLDMYDPANGPPYEPAFLDRYRAAQVARNERITAWVLDELERLAGHGMRDRLFTVSRTWADPRFVDPALDPSERPTPACLGGDPERANRSVLGVGLVNSLRTWLSMFSLEYSQCRAGPHLARITVPSLVVQGDADVGVFPSDAVAMHAGLAAADKELITMPGDHYFLAGAEDVAASARDVVANRMAEWVANRV